MDRPETIGQRGAAGYVALERRMIRNAFDHPMSPPGGTALPVVIEERF
jgi:hypothetical protein